MSVIQSIREKYAKWAVVAIALALLGFILTDYLSTRNQLFGGSNSTVIGSVNGKEIEYIIFENKLKTMDAQAEAQGQRPGENERHQNIERLWNQEIEQIIMNAEFEKTGISIGKKELNDWLFGNNPPQDLKQRFTDEQGQYSPAAAQDAINQMKRSANQADREQLNNYLAAIEYSRQTEKFNSLLSNSVYYPKWYVEKQNAEASGLAKVSYTSYPYARVSDTAVVVSDKEIEEYISKHKDQYKQETSRSISYIVFSASPTAADSAAVKTQVAALKPEFEKAPDPAAFLARFGSAIQYYDGYVGKSQIQVPVKDSIFALAKNAVYGPYQDNNTYALAKLIDIKPMPDSVKARHILIQTADPQRGQQLLEDSVAKKRIDSIDVAIKKGASFDSLARKYSDDKGSGEKGGLLSNPSNAQTNYFNIGQMVKEFNDFSFEGKKGEKKIVKTVFGYHLIEILDQKNFQPHYKIAYFAKNIVASDETDRTALSEASKFASESRDMYAFDDNFEKTLKKQGYQKLVATNIKPNDNTIEGISAFGLSRQLVREIYKADGGDVLQQQRVGDKYIVATVTGIYKEGTMSVAEARKTIEPLLKNKKKAEQIKQKIGKISTLEAAAIATGDPVRTIDSLRFTGGQLGFEPKVIGAAFNGANKGKLITEPIAGSSGVYVLRVDDLSSTAVAAANIEEQKKNSATGESKWPCFIASPSGFYKKEQRSKTTGVIFIKQLCEKTDNEPSRPRRDGFCLRRIS
jgi:peptidyl-prolyl cis-trans isomerase D